MKVELAIKNMEAVTQELTQGGLGVAMLRAAENARSVIFNRVTETGKDAQGNQYRAYSTKPMLTNCSALLTSACSSQMSKKDLHWVTLKRVNKAGKRVRVFELEGGYKEFREIQGRQTAYVDFSFTGDMWKSIQVTTGMEEAKKGRAVVTANNDKDMAKLAGNTERRGEILDLSDSEVDTLAEIFNEELMDIFRKYDLV